MAGQSNAGSRWAVRVVLAIAVGGASGIVTATVLSGQDSGDEIASIVGGLFTVITFAVNAWFLFRPSRPSPVDGQALVDGAVRDLAEAVKADSRREEERRRISDPFALPVDWHTAADEAFDHWDNIRDTPGRTHTGPVELDGELARIRETYQEIPSGRLVILGRAGSGKTVLAHRLILDLIDHRDATDPVPVLFHLNNWNPTTPLRDWLVERLLRDYSGLEAVAATGTNLAATLVDRRVILPVLDGFDEITEGHHRNALTQLNTLGGRLVLTSRPYEYTTATRDSRVLAKAAAVELDDLPLDQVARYLDRSTGKTRTSGGGLGTAWQPVLDHLRDEPHDPASKNLADVLTTPLMVMLARTLYSDTSDHDPAELLDTARFPTPHAIENHLLDAFLPALYSRPSLDSTTSRRRTWIPEKAQRWHGHLAAHLDALDTRDLAWWQLHHGLSRRTRFLSAALGFGIAVWLLFGLAGALQIGPRAGVAEALGYALTYAPFFALALGFAFGVASLPKKAEREPERLVFRLRRRGRAHTAPRKAVARSAFETFAESRWALLGGLAGALVGGTVYPLVFSDPAGVSISLGIGLMFGLVFGLVNGLVNVLVSWIADSSDLTMAVSPWRLLAADRATSLVRAAVFGPVFALIFMLTFELGTRPDWSVSSLVLRLVVDLAVFAATAAVYRALVSAWGRWLVFVRLWLPLTGRLPWRVAAFLDDAHQRGVLRQAGAVYQFRHVRLQDRLAHTHQQKPHQSGSQPETDETASTKPR